MAGAIGKMGREKLQEFCANLTRAIKETMPEGVGFTLIMFDFGSKGNLAYASTGRREDMIETLEEMLKKIRGGDLTAKDSAHRKRS